jgi:tRNA 2-selenouridine synthase
MSDDLKCVSIEEFLAAPGTLFDVRSPCEFDHGHIPGASSLPLFTDEERAQVGTVYKQNGKEIAIQVGLRLLGPKLESFAKSLRKGSNGVCRITCFRGGMRSRSVQWLASLFGIETIRLEGGYKAFRHYVLETFSSPYSFIVIGGATGSGKTEIIQAIAKSGYKAIDLENLASHRGSAFGLIPGAQQPTQEHFENLLATSLRELKNPAPIFLEDESRLIGACMIPQGIYENMDRSVLLWVEVPFEKRLLRLVETYGCFPKSWLLEKTVKLTKRLGGEQTKKVVTAIEEDRLKDAACLLLEYYDKAYLHSRSLHPRKVIPIQEEDFHRAIADRSLDSVISFDPRNGSSAVLRDIRF